MMNATLIHTESGKRVPTGGTLHMADATCWRHEGIAEHPKGDHPGRVHVSRMTGAGRQHRTYPPHMFGCHISVNVRIYGDTARLERLLRHLTGHMAVWLAEAVVAWIVAVLATHWIGG